MPSSWWCFLFKKNEICYPKAKECPFCITEVQESIYLSSSTVTSSGKDMLVSRQRDELIIFCFCQLEKLCFKDWSWTCRGCKCAAYTHGAAMMKPTRQCLRKGEEREGNRNVMEGCTCSRYSIHTELLQRNTSYYYLFGGGTRVWTQGFMLAKQVLYWLNHIFSPLCSGILEMRSLDLFALGGLKPWNLNLPSS
jgi:hypothetical protein